MGIPNATVVQLAVEGISTLNDLSEFSKDDINNLADSLRRMRVPAVADGPPVEQQRFVMGARSQKRLAVAVEILRYYKAVGRTLTAANMRWETLSNFEIQWKAIQEKKNGDRPETPKLSKGVTVMKWSESIVARRRTPTVATKANGHANNDGAELGARTRQQEGGRGKIATEAHGVVLKAHNDDLGLVSVFKYLG